MRALLLRAALQMQAHVVQGSAPGAVDPDGVPVPPPGLSAEEMAELDKQHQMATLQVREAARARERATAAAPALSSRLLAVTDWQLRRRTRAHSGADEALLLLLLSSLCWLAAHRAPPGGAQRVRRVCARALLQPAQPAHALRRGGGGGAGPQAQPGAAGQVVGEPLCFAQPRCMPIRGLPAAVGAGRAAFRAARVHAAAFRAEQQRLAAQDAAAPGCWHHRLCCAPARAELHTAPDGHCSC